MVQKNTYMKLHGEQAMHWGIRNKENSNLTGRSPFAELAHQQDVVLYHVTINCKGPISSP